ncbi:MAG: hypothetical protein ACTSYL_09045 [Candidatus Thorarchaeota archaeon]
MKKWPFILLIIAVAICLFSSSLDVVANDSVIVTRGRSVVIVASLGGTVPPDIPLEGQVIWFFDESHDLLIGSNKTDHDGVAMFCWNIPRNYYLGYTLVNTTFRGNISLALAPSAQWIWMDIMASSNLDISLESTNLAPGDFLNISARLHDDLGAPLSNVTLSLSTNSDTIGVTTTDENGTAYFVEHCNSSWLQFGTNRLVVAFLGDPSLHILPTSSDFQIDFQKIPTSIDLISFTDRSLTINKTLTMNLSLNTPSDFISGGAIHVFLDGLEIRKYSTGDTGNFTIELYLSSNISIGSHTLRFLYFGTDRYSLSSLDFSFNVTTPLLVNVTIPQPLVLGSWGTIYIHPYDLFGHPVASGELRLSEESTNLSILIGLDSTGENVIRFPVRGVRGYHILSLSITKNDFLHNSSLDIQTIYYSRPEIILVNSTIQGYARPEQQISFYLNIKSESGPWGNHELIYNLSVSNEQQTQTDQYGYAQVTLDAPLNESTYCVNISTIPGSFEIPASFLYNYSVRVKIPTTIELIEFLVLPVLKEVEVRLQIIALNGSTLPNVDLYYSWISISGQVVSNTDGLVVLHLPIPSQSGIYRLFYEIMDAPTIAAASGFYDLSIDSTDVMASQGVGFGPFTTSIILSVFIVIVAGIRKRKTMI